MNDRFEQKEEELDVDDYRVYFDSKIFRVWHLQGKQRLFRIVRVTRLTSEMFAGGSRKVTQQPKLELATRDGEVIPLPFLLNKVNAKTIAQLYGKRPREWVGKWIQLYPTTTEKQDEIVDCIRVRNEVPGSRPRRGNKQGVNVLPPPAPNVPPSSLAARAEAAGVRTEASTDVIGAQRAPGDVPPSEPAPLDHERARKNDEGDDDSLEAEYEVVQ